MRLSRRQLAQAAALLTPIIGAGRAAHAAAAAGTQPFMFGVDSQHTGRLRVAGPRTLALAWRELVWSRVEAGVAVGPDGTVFVPRDIGEVIAFTPDGRRKWAYTAPDWLKVPLAVDAAGNVLLPTSVGQLVALKPDGKVAWIFEADGGIVAPLTFGHNGEILFGTDTGGRHYLYPDGRQRYRYSSEGAIRAAPAVAPDATVYWVSDEGLLYATGADGADQPDPIRLVGEQPWWRLKPSTSPVVDDNGHVYVGAVDGTLVALDPARFDRTKTLDSTPSERWRVRIGTQALGTPAITPTGTLLIGGEQGVVRAVNAADGTLVWEYATGGTVTVPPLIGPDGSIYVASGDSHVYILDAQGQVVSAYKTGEGIPGPPALAPDGSLLYVGSRDHHVYAIKDGRPGLRTPALPDGAVRDARDGAVYLVLSGARHHVPDPATFALWGLDWAQVASPAAAAIDALLLGPPLPRLTDGAAVRTPDGMVFVVRPGRWEWVPTPEAFAAAGLRWEEVLAVPAGALRFAPVAAPDGLLLRGGDGRVYLIDGGARRWIPDPQTFAARGFAWEQVRPAPDELLARLREGPQVTAS